MPYTVTTGAPLNYLQYTQTGLPYVNVFGADKSMVQCLRYKCPITKVK